MNPLRRQRADQGMVLVMTVLVLGILVVVAYAFSYGAGVNAATARNVRDALRRETACEGALEYAAALLRQDASDGDVDALDEDWAAPDLAVSIDGELMTVRIVDEDRKLNVNRAALPGDPEKQIDLRAALQRLLRAAGGGNDDFEALCSWIDPKNSGPHDGLAPKRALPMISALRAVPDLNAQLLRGENGVPPLADLLCTHPRRVNVNTAPPEVLDALWDDSRATRAILDRRKSGPIASDSDLETLLRELLPEETAVHSMPVVSVRSEYFAVRILPAAGNGLSALVRRQGPSVQVLYVAHPSEETVP